MIGRIGSRPVLLAASMILLLAATSTGEEQRLTPGEALALPIVAAGAGTSGVSGIETRLLHGDPKRPSLYTISIRVPPNTTIAAHTHGDSRTAVVAAGI